MNTAQIIFVICIVIVIIGGIIMSINYWKMMDNYNIRDRNMDRANGLRNDPREKYWGEKEDD